jgi:hypothetical protein
MSATITFIPQHQQPFTLEQAMLLEVDMLVAGESVTCDVVLGNDMGCIASIRVSKRQKAVS